MSAMGRTKVAAGLAVAALLVAFGWYATIGRPVSTGPAPGDPVARSAVPDRSATTLPCHQVLHCAARQAMQDASARCRPGIETLAVYAPKWTQGAGEPIFTDYVWSVRQQGTITYMGNRAEFRTGGGGYAPVAYECDYDPAAQKVLDVRAKGAGFS